MKAYHGALLYIVSLSSKVLLPPIEGFTATPFSTKNSALLFHNNVNQNNHHLVSSTSSSFSLHSKSKSQSISESQLESESESELEYDHECECLIIGGGISGSTLAHNLHYHHNTNILLTEARDYLGGNVKSHVTDDGYVWEEGPNSFATQPSIVRIAHELNIDDQLVFADESLPPWVNHNGKLHPLPKGKGGKGPKGQLELVFGSNGVLKFALLGQLLSWPGKIRAGIGAFVGHEAPPSPSSSGENEETIREWVTRTLGEEVFLRCIDPFVSGVYAGNPMTLSMTAALPKIANIENIAYSIPWNKGGAIFYGGLKRQVELTKERKANPPEDHWVEFEYGNPGSFRKGLSTLPNAIHEELKDKIKLEWTLVKIRKLSSSSNSNSNNNNDYIATYETANGSIQRVRTQSIVSTIPAHALQGSILSDILPQATQTLNKARSYINRTKGIYHPPVAAVTVAYPKSAFKDMDLPNDFGKLKDLPGFGNLNPRSENVRTLGTLWSSSLFPDRAPSTHNLLLNYIGGSRDVDIGTMSDDDIIDEVDRGCRTVLLKDDAPPPKVLGIKLWPTAIPQYELGHKEIMDELKEAEDTMDGLWICGNYRSGVAFPDCVTFGYDHAKVVKEYLDGIQLSSPSSSSKSDSQDKNQNQNQNQNQNELEKVPLEEMFFVSMK